MTARPVRVSMVHGPASPEHDGVSDYVRHLCAALTAERVHVEPVVLGPQAGTSPGRRDWLRAAGRVAAHVRRTRPDLVHTQFAPSAYGFSGAPGLLPPMLPREVPVVTTVHEYGWWSTPAWVPPGLWTRLERARLWDRESGRLVPASAAVLASNAEHAAAVQDRVGAAAVEVPIAPNVAVHRDAQARRRLRRELGLPPGAPLLVFFGFVHPVKGIRYAIEALPALQAVAPGAHLLVVGGFTSAALPPDEARQVRADLAGLAVRLGLGSHVTLTGHLDDVGVSHALQAADVGVLPFTAGVSTKSGALLAMLAHGLPVAATAADDRDPLLRDGETVVEIAARRDATAVAVAVQRLLDDPRLRDTVAAGGMGLAARHTWPAIARWHRAVYDEVLRHRRA